MKIYEVKELIHKYGEYITLADLLKTVQGDYLYECPKCKGKGYNVVEYNAYPNGLPDSGFVYEAGYKDVPCEVCGKVGYTKEELVPKYVQDGYEKKVESIK